MSVTITTLANNVKQPRGGYLPVKLFKETHYESENELFPDENGSKSLIGTTVDNMTRVLLGAKPKEVFQPATFGMMKVRTDIFGDDFDLIDEVTGLDDDSILAAYQLSFYEQIYRSGYIPSTDYELELPDEHTIENIREMVNRSLRYFQHQAKLVNVGDRLAVKYKGDNIYGDYDYLTDDSLIDMKVLSKKIANKYTLQIILYWILGMKSKKKLFSNVKYLKFYNPRLNVEYSFDLDELTPDILKPILEEVLMAQ